MLGSRLDPHFLSLAFHACCYFFSSFHFFPLNCVSSLVSAISEEVFTVFSRNLFKSMQDKNTRLCAATVGDNIFPNAATVLWYLEAFLRDHLLPSSKAVLNTFFWWLELFMHLAAFSKSSISSFFFWRAILVSYNCFLFVFIILVFAFCFFLWHRFCN